jgi:muramoyltetrapeptide carboxypeptidase
MIPARLNKGDVIGIIAPSTPVLPELRGQFDAGVHMLKSLGFDVLVGEHVFSTNWGYTAAPEDKAADINHMVANPAVKAVICARGGATGNTALAYLDWKMIHAHPKIFLGISDGTPLLNAIYHKTGLVTFHGNDVMWGFGRTPTSYDVDEFVARLVEGAIGPVKRSGSRKTVRGGRAEGTLVGGNLHCLMKLAGTPYWPDLTGTILFLEAIGITPETCDTLFYQMDQMGVFDQVGGVMIGFIDGLQNNPDATHQMEEVLARITADRQFPILKGDEFGHNCPNTTLPIGGRVLVDADAQEVVILEACVS